MSALVMMVAACSSRTAFERATFAPASPAVVVFIHGFTSDNSVWPQDAIAAMAGGLNGDSYLFSYESSLFDILQTSQTTAEAADRLALELSRPEFAGREINLVGHSQGGIVALRTLLKMPKGNVKRIILLGTPLFGSKGIPPDWLLPGQSGQLKELNEHSRSLLELNLDLQKHLAEGKKPAIFSVLSSVDEYVSPHSAFVNLPGSRNAIVDVSHNDLPLLLTEGISGLRSRWRSAPGSFDGMENALLIKAPELRELHYFIRETVDYDPPEADLRAGGYQFHSSVGRDMTAGHTSGRPPILESLKRYASEFMFDSEQSVRKMGMHLQRADGSVSRVRFPEKRYAGIGFLPSRCEGENRTLTRIWVRASDTPPLGVGNVVPSDMLECLDDGAIRHHLSALGYNVALQRQIVRRDPDGDIIVTHRMPMAQMIARRLLSSSADWKACDPSTGRLEYEFVDNRFQAIGSLSAEERAQMETLLGREGAPPPPFFFSRCKTDERIAVSGYWLGEYLVIHNLKPGVYHLSPGEIMASFNGGHLGDGFELDAEAVFKRHEKRTYDIFVKPGTTVWELP